MHVRKLVALILGSTVLSYSQTSFAVTIDSSGETGGPTPAQLVFTLVDPLSDYSVVAASENTTINASGSPASNPRAMGTFSNGITTKGTLLPATNQNTAGDAAYEGGIGIEAGICLCTGLCTDGDSQVQGVPSDRGVGVEGPNRGFPISTSTGEQPGELSFVLGKPSDADFVSEVSAGQDATVLQFKITLTSPGIIRVTFVHGSDEHPFYSLSTYNDTPLLLVGDENGLNFENIITFTDSSGMSNTLTLSDLNHCGLLRENLVAPAPALLTTSRHAAVNTNLYFDHEFAGFTEPLTREGKCVLAPGTYTIKLVIQDVADARLDSATFFEASSLKLYSFLLADFNLDGKIDGLDFSILSFNFGMTDAKFTDGDANGDGTVDGSDYSILSQNFGQTGGNANFCADFNRDGTVDGLDFSILSFNFGLAECASRFEGDADGDGDVDGDDFSILSVEFAPNGTPSGQCDCD